MSAGDRAMDKSAKTLRENADAAGAPLVIDGRYEAREVLKESRTTRTCTGLDRQTGALVVIKTICSANIPAGIQVRLELEADILRKIRHPLMTPLLSVGRQDGLFFLVTPQQPGVNLRSVLGGGRLGLDDALTVGRCVLDLLCETHKHGIFHRDIKPANVIVDRAAPLTQAMLVDFGLTHSTQLDVARGDQSVESVRYLAPEQAGLLDVDVGAYSDLFSLGCVLFECLTGQPPVDGRTVGDVLRNQLTVQPPKLRSFGLEVPRALEEILQRMLRKDPRDRYQSASAVRFDLVALIDALAQGETEPSLVVGLQDRRTTLTEPAFVGREDEIRLLDDQIQQTRQGTGGLILIEAESGGGKSRLLNEWARRNVSGQLWVLRGQAVDQIGHRPFQILKGVADEIVAEASAAPRLAASLRQRLGASAESVGAVLPELSSVFRLDPARTLGPEAFAERRSIDALSHLLRHLGSEQRPAVVILDDCQWADDLSVRLLVAWMALRGESAGADSWVTVVAAFRSDEVAPEHCLRKLQPSLHLRLAPFGTADLQSLVESMAGPLPTEVLDVVGSLSGGSPFMASAVLRGMVESKALVSEATCWRIDRHAMDDFRSSQHAAQLLTRRVQLLPLVAVDLLKAAAVLGKEFELEVAANLAGLVMRHAMVGCREAQARHLIWMRAGSERCIFVHDKVRETFLQQLSDADRQDLQRRAAQLLEQIEPPPVFDLAHLYDAAGDNQRALRYAVEAAEQARAQHSLEITEQLYRIAVRDSLGVDEPTRFRIASGLGDVLMLRGRYDAASQMFEAAKFVATGLAKGDIAKAAIEGKLGELAFKRGDMETAANSIQRGLDHLGRWAPKKDDSLLVPLMKEILVQTLHSILPGLFVGRRSLDRAERDLAAARLYHRLGHAYWFTRGKIPTIWVHLRHMNLMELYPATLELAQAYSNHAPAASLVGWFTRGEAYAQRSLRIRQQAGDLWGQAQSLHYAGIVLYAASRFEECIEKCREAVRLFQRTGDYWETNMARYQLAAALYRLGDLAAAVEEAKRIHQSGVEVGDVQASRISLDIWSWASEGKVPADVIEVELHREPENKENDDVQVKAQILVAEGVRLISDQRYRDAVSVLDHAWKITSRAGVHNAWVAPILPWLSTALRLQAQNSQGYTGREKRRLLAEAKRVARRALRITRTFRNDLPHLLREQALLMAMGGKLRAARRCFARSLTEARRQKAEFEYAQSLLYRGLVGQEAGWQDASKDVDEAERQIAKLRRGVVEDRDESSADGSESSYRVATLSLADRFDTVLDVGRKIASGLTRDAIFRSVQDAALQLLRGERCLLISIPEDPSAGSLDGAAPDKLTRRLVHDAIQTGQSIVYSAGSSDVDAAHGTATRSAICAPIHVRHKAQVCVYVSHHQVSDLFGDDEKRLADFIAAIAGAALENADGFEALQRLNATLEQRVTDRTADLELRTDELARSNADLEQFAYVASHDLREPLRTVNSYCQLLQERLQGQLDEEAASYIRNAIEAAGRMRTLITDLLAYSRVGTRGKPFEPTDCNQVFDMAMSNLRLVIEETGACVTREELPTVPGDPTQLLRLFQNLIDNAIKFRSDRVPQVHVTATGLDDSWKLAIRDNGIGMATNDASRVFLIFQRLHHEREHAGTGIGLAVCKKIVERHGGHIWVESSEKAGSTFFFTIARELKHRGCIE